MTNLEDDMYAYVDMDKILENLPDEEFETSTAFDEDIAKMSKCYKEQYGRNSWL